MAKTQKWGRRYSDNQAYPKSDTSGADLPKPDYPVGRKTVQYLTVSTPNLPTGHFLLTAKEVKDFQDSTTKRRSGGKESLYIIVSTPTLSTGHFLMTEKEITGLQAKTRNRGNGVPKRDSSGGGTRANIGRGGCDTTEPTGKGSNRSW